MGRRVHGDSQSVEASSEAQLKLLVLKRISTNMRATILCVLVFMLAYSEGRPLANNNGFHGGAAENSDAFIFGGLANNNGFHGGAAENNDAFIFGGLANNNGFHRRS